MRLTAVATALLLTLACIHADAQTRIEERLSAEQMRATGLSRLTADELAELNRVLAADVREVERAAEARAREQERDVREAPRTAVESTIPGPFDGWEAGRTLTLADGTRWRVVEGTLTVRKGARSDVPVRIAPGFLGAWYLKAEGEVPQAKVRKVD